MFKYLVAFGNYLDRIYFLAYTSAACAPGLSGLLPHNVLRGFGGQAKHFGEAAVATTAKAVTFLVQMVHFRDLKLTINEE